MKDFTKEEKREIKKSLVRAQRAQTKYWEALQDLEAELGVDMDDVGDLENYDVDTLIEEYTTENEEK